VLVNGTGVGQHRGGYDRFSFDLTDSLRWSGEERIVGGHDPTEGPARGKHRASRRGFKRLSTPQKSGLARTYGGAGARGCIDKIKSNPDIDAKSRALGAANSLSDKTSHRSRASAAGKEAARITLHRPTRKSFCLAGAPDLAPDDPFL